MAKELSPLGRAALRYAADALFVFPLIPGQHRPLIKDMYSASSVDTAQIEAWWNEWPNANIGLDCGKSGVVVIDVDPKNGGDKVFPGLRMLMGGPKAWKTRKHGTPSGGEHYIFEAPPQGEDGLRTGSDRFGKGTGIDVRARGGYIVLPPSKRTGYGTETYTVLDRSNPRPLPAVLRFPARHDRDAAGRTELEAKLFDGERIPLGAQDAFLAAVAGRLRRTGFEDVEIAAVLRETYALRCEPAPKGTKPHTDEDFLRLARSAERYPVVETFLDDAKLAVGDTPLGEWDDSDQTISVNAGAFLRDTTDVTNWIVENLFQGCSLNQFVGGPKAGKSTMLRRLAVDIAYGQPWLGRFATKPTRVLYYSLQENKAHLRSWLAQQARELALAGVVIDDEWPIDFVFRLGRRGAPAVKGLLARCKRKAYGFVIVDMFGRFSGLKSMDDYAEVETLCDALKDVADQTGACILWAHHERKTRGPNPFEGTLGSQAIRGAVYTTALMTKDQGKYYLSTEQREGDDLDETAITYNKETGAMRAAGSRLSTMIVEDAQRRERASEIFKFRPNITPKQLHDQIGGRSEFASTVLRELRAQGD